MFNGTDANEKGSLLAFVPAEATHSSEVMKPHPNRVAHEACDVVDPESFHQESAMRLDRLDAQAQILGDGLGRFPSAT